MITYRSFYLGAVLTPWRVYLFMSKCQKAMYEYTEKNCRVCDAKTGV